jgi:hypothetical protein
MESTVYRVWFLVARLGRRDISYQISAIRRQEEEVEESKVES